MMNSVSIFISSFDIFTVVFLREYFAAKNVVVSDEQFTCYIFAIIPSTIFSYPTGHKHKGVHIIKPFPEDKENQFYKTYLLQ